MFPNEAFLVAEADFLVACLAPITGIFPIARPVIALFNSVEGFLLS